MQPKKGTPGRKDWVSKVDWRAADRVDPSNIKWMGFKNEPMDQDIRGEIQSTVLTVNATTKMNEIVGKSRDPINDLHN